ncbi:MAG: transporter [Bacteroidetes bacterium]|nr:transporter [Bacteroidota bacterium]
MQKIIISVFILSNSFFLFAQSINNKKLRELSPDRPHQTESPITVDKKHIMFELDLINYTKETQLKETFSTFGIGFLNVKVGITKKMDIELISGCYKNRFSEMSSVPKHSYFEDFTLRYKYNITGNDSGNFALAIMPLIRTTNFFQDTFRVLNGGLLLNAEWEVMKKFGVGYTGGISSFSVNPMLKQTELFSTVSFDYKLVGDLRQFAEVSYRYNNSGSLTHNYSVDSGITFTPKQNWQIDCGIYYFIPERKPFIFIGGTIRI